MNSRNVNRAVPERSEMGSLAHPASLRDSVSAIENDREFKAHIYQQLIDLQPFLAPDSQISVLVQLNSPVGIAADSPVAASLDSTTDSVEASSDFSIADDDLSDLRSLSDETEDDDRDDDRDEDEPASIGLSLVATIGDYQIEAQGRDDDLYEAFALAKQAMIYQLEEYHAAATDSHQRDAEIRSILTGANTIH